MDSNATGMPEENADIGVSFVYLKCARNERGARTGYNRRACPFSMSQREEND